MPRQTIKNNWTPSDPVGATDLNNVGDNLLYILDENTVFTGSKSFSANTDTVHYLSRLKLGSDFSDHVTLYHYDLSGNDYGVRINPSGTATLNSTALNNIEFRQQNFLYATFNSLSSSINTNLIVDDTAEIAKWDSVVGYARFGHKDYNEAENFGYLQQDNGRVYIQSPRTFLHIDGNSPIIAGTSAWNNASFFQVGNNTDEDISLGRFRIGVDFTDHATLYHGNFSSTGYTLRVNPSGTTALNSVTGNNVEIRQENVLNADFNSTVINMYRDTVCKNDLTVDGNILPTTTPTEQTISRTTTGTTLLPRGVHHFHIFASGSGTSRIIIEKFINGTWETLREKVLDNGTDNETQALIASSGTDTRLNIPVLGGSSAGVYAITY